MTIILSSLNARYIHSSLGLRYLKANMGALEHSTEIKEFDLQKRPVDIVETLLQTNPSIIGFGVYIWNLEQTTQVISLIKIIRPEIIIISGGPEVSYEYEKLTITNLSDYVITGAADLAFAKLCGELSQQRQPEEKVIHAQFPSPLEIQLPYYLYTNEDIKNRVIYVEASRGCPFKCEFCLSALDKTSVPFDMDVLMENLDKLYQRGARQFKFVDRTFNLNIRNSIRILEFFQKRLNENLFVHFEVIPDHLPEKLKSIIAVFPEGSLQFEVGIQSFNPEVQTLINRKQDNKKTIANLQWLKQHTKVHLHTDLIVGLPGESIQSIADSFNQLVSLEPQEIQVGILKRLRGTPIVRHANNFSMSYNPNPPYNLLKSDTLDFITMQRLSRFARYWDLIGNSGRFKASLGLLLGQNPFERFMNLSDYLYQRIGQTHKISLQRLFENIFLFLTQDCAMDKQLVCPVLVQDHLSCGIKSPPNFLDRKQYVTLRKQIKQNGNTVTGAIRQSRHIGA